MIRDPWRAFPWGAALVLALALVGLAAAAFAREEGYARLGIVVKEGRDGPRRGARVIEVLGPRAGRDLRRGDLVIRVDGVRVHDGAEIRDVLRDAEDDPIAVDVLRHGERTQLLVDRVDGRSASRDDDRIAIRRVIGDVRRDVRVEVRDGRDRLREELRRLRRELQELELRMDAEGIR